MMRAFALTKMAGIWNDYGMKETLLEKQWPSERLLADVTGRCPAVEEVCVWTCDKMVLYAFDQLQQPAGSIETYINGLLHEEWHGFASEKQRKMLFQLHAEASSILVLVHLLLLWLVSNHVIDGNTVWDIARTTEEPFVTYFAEKHLTLQQILSWPKEQFVQYVSHALRQQSTAATRVLDVLLAHEEQCGFTSDEQQDVLVSVQNDVGVVHWMTGYFDMWLSKAIS